MALETHVTDGRSDLESARKYFLDRGGVPAGRMAGSPGAGHIEVAQTVLGSIAPGRGVHAQRFALGFVHVLETEPTSPGSRSASWTPDAARARA